MAELREQEERLVAIAPAEEGAGVAEDVDRFEADVGIDLDRPARPSCLAALAVEYQDFRQALTHYLQLLDVAGSGAVLLYNIGLLHQKLGRAKEAVGYYRQALAEKPDFTEAWLNLGHALMILGSHDEARSSWKNAVAGNSELAEQFLV